MIVEADCKNCGHSFDGHWSKTGLEVRTALGKKIMLPEWDWNIICPKCKKAGFVKTTTDEDQDYKEAKG